MSAPVQPRILGLILNGVSINNPDYYYTAYYYSHYTYGRAVRPALPEGDGFELRTTSVSLADRPPMNTLR